MRLNSPCGHLPRRRPRVHHIPSRVRDDRDTPLLSRRDSAEIATDLGRRGSDLYLWSRLDDPNQIESVQQIRFFAHRLFPAMGSASGWIERSAWTARSASHSFLDAAAPAPAT